MNIPHVDEPVPPLAPHDLKVKLIVYGEGTMTPPTLASETVTEDSKNG